MSKFGVYVTKNKQSKGGPAILTLENNILSLKTDKEQLFSSDLSNVTAVFALLGTLVITLTDTKKRYNLVNGYMAGAAAKKFSPVQIAEIENDIKSQHEGIDQARATAGLAVGGLATSAIGNSTNNTTASAAGVGMQGAAVVIGLIKMIKAFRQSHELVQRIEAAGLAITYRSHKPAKGMWLYGVILILSLFVFFGFVTIVAGLASLASDEYTTSGSVGMMIFGLVSMILFFVPIRLVYRKISR